MSLNINSHISGCSPVQTRKVAKLVMQWCLDNLGENRRSKKDLYVHLDFEDSDGMDYADFNVEKNRIITIYMDVNLTFKHLISSLIHEYVHHLQFWCHYQELYEKHGYKNHPYEIEARRIEKEFTSICWDEIRDRVDKILRS